MNTPQPPVSGPDFTLPAVKTSALVMLLPAKRPFLDRPGSRAILAFHVQPVEVFDFYIHEARNACK